MVDVHFHEVCGQAKERALLFRRSALSSCLYEPSHKDLCGGTVVFANLELSLNLWALDFTKLTFAPAFAGLMN